MKTVLMIIIAIMWPLVATTGAAVPATQPALLSASSSVEQVLDALDARGKNIQDFSATVKITNTNTAVGDSDWSQGTVVMQRKSAEDSRIRVALTEKQEGRSIIDIDEQYTLDNGELVDRDYKEKKEVRQQVLKPGEKVNLFKLGQGPFPLPLGQSRQDVEDMFDVVKIAAASDDPAGTVHLQLTPKAGTQFARNYKTIDVWVDLATAMPRRIETLDPNETLTRTTDLTDVKINSGVGEKDFAQPPKIGEWDSIDQPYGG